MNRLARQSFAKIPSKFGATDRGVVSWNYWKKGQKTGDRTLIGLCLVSGNSRVVNDTTYVEKEVARTRNATHVDRSIF